MKNTLLALLLTLAPCALQAQDTFSIVALDSVTGEVGSAGASCVNLIPFGLPADFLGELFPGVGAINSQASYLAANQANARARMQAGDTPAQIIAWLQANDVQNNPGVRQYGIVGFVNGQPQSAAHTGGSTLTYASHRLGATYSIQGNILLGPEILDSMEARFLNAPGPLANKLMAALQGANVPGADTRCLSNGTSSLFAFLKVSTPTDAFGSPSLNLGVTTAAGAQIEPIDSLQVIFNAQFPTGLPNPVTSTARPFAIAPNPASNELLLWGEGVTGVTIFNLLGKKQLEQNTFSALGKVNVSKLSPGIYLAQVTGPNGQMQILRFVKE